MTRESATAPATNSWQEAAVSSTSREATTLLRRRLGAIPGTMNVEAINVRPWTGHWPVSRGSFSSLAPHAEGVWGGAYNASRIAAAALPMTSAFAFQLASSPSELRTTQTFSLSLPTELLLPTSTLIGSTSFLLGQQRWTVSGMVNAETVLSSRGSGSNIMTATVFAISNIMTTPAFVASITTPLFAASNVITATAFDPHQAKEIAVYVGQAFARAEEESFEDGVPSKFASTLASLIRKFGSEAVKAVERALESPSVDVEVAGEALRRVGAVQHAPSKKFRLSILKKHLSSASSRIQYAAALGVAAMDDPAAIPAIAQVLQNRNQSDVQRCLKRVLEQLEDTQQRCRRT